MFRALTTFPRPPPPRAPPHPSRPAPPPQVSEQTDSLRVLGSDPVDYLITPRVVACMIATPLLNILCFCMGEYRGRRRRRGGLASGCALLCMGSHPLMPLGPRWARSL